MKRWISIAYKKIYGFILRPNCTVCKMDSHEDHAQLLEDNSSLRHNSGSLFNVILLGLAFMVIFSAFNTHANMSQMVMDSIHEENPSFSGSGYASLAVVYGVFAVTNWLAPSVLSTIGPKWTMIAGASTYVLFIGSFIWPQTWLLYSVSALVGLGAAILWTGQGNYFTLISNEMTIARNSGIFWALLQCSFLFGNLFVFFAIRGEKIMNSETRILIYSVLTAIGLAGVILMFFLRRPHVELASSYSTSEGPFLAFKKSILLFKTKDMMLLAATFFYTGIELSFFSGVYSPCIGFTLRFSDPKRLVGLSGIFIGVGEILGGALFGIFGKRTIKWGRDPIIFLGFLIHLISFFLIFLNLPSSSPFGNTHQPSYFPSGNPSEFVAIFCSFLLGFGDACFNTQIYTILGSVYSENSGPAFAIFKFIQSLAAAACFFYASVLSLNWHILILVISGTLGTLTFFFVEKNDRRNRQERISNFNGD